MISVTADTNIYVSALIFSGVPRQFLNQAEGGRFRLAISAAIRDELRGVLRDKFAWAETDIAETLSLLADCTTLVQPSQTLDVVPDDPDDNRVIECAVAAGSRFIVTGDGDLLRLGSYSNIKMLKAAEFLKLLEGPTAHESA